MRKSTYQYSLPQIQQLEKSSSRRIHSKKMMLPKCIPTRYPKFDVNQQSDGPPFRHGPIRVDPKITQTFSQFKSIALLNFNDQLYYKYQDQKRQQKQREFKQQRKQRYLNEKASINYFQEQDEDVEQEVQEIMHRFKSDQSDNGDQTEMPKLRIKF